MSSSTPTPPPQDASSTPTPPPQDASSTTPTAPPQDEIASPWRWHTPSCQRDCCRTDSPVSQGSEESRKYLKRLRWWEEQEEAEYDEEGEAGASSSRRRSPLVARQVE
eukprot:2648466-Prymnesium_polylepis.1